MKDGVACGVPDLLSRARSGDATAFAGLVRTHQRLVYSLALRMLTDRYKAEDLAQEVFIRLHRKLVTIESAAHLMFWLRKVTTHLAIDRLRVEPKYEIVPLEAGAGVADGADGGDDPLLRRHLRVLIAELQPPAARAVLLLRYQEDLDPTEIAEILDMPVNTVKSHLKRSLASLRDRLASSVTI